MQAATAAGRVPAPDLPTDKAQRIVEAMRASVAARGIAGATFDHVAREAGVSRGLLHYHFGTKERLLVEVVRREAELRGNLLDEAVAAADGPDELIDALVRNLKEVLGAGRSEMVTFYELLALGQRNAEIAGEVAQLAAAMRTRLAAALRSRSSAGAFTLRSEAEHVAALLLALADGVAIRRLAEPELDLEPLIALAVAAARAQLA
ncbi:MAG TPA: helix-turn-helix domain-containing protein [Solirubrobacteraceae bacterium]|nr:helix-turn-helix domain-containing protein [Solirubrobacteraceae bacterium]